MRDRQRRKGVREGVRKGKRIKGVREGERGEGDREETERESQRQREGGCIDETVQYIPYIQAVTRVLGTRV